MFKEATHGLDSTLKELIKILEIKLNKDIEYQDCSVEESIQKVASMLNVQIQTERITFVTDLQVQNLHYPSAYLESVLYNLITNAIKYRRRNVQTEIVIKTYIEDLRVVLEVCDNGLGIDLTRYGHQIFKLNKVFHKGFDSKGLGLFILKNQIETLGGKISVNSEPNQGSAFKVVF
jgi:signal transduction histidine kinase